MYETRQTKLFELFYNILSFIMKRGYLVFILFVIFLSAAGCMHYPQDPDYSGQLQPDALLLKPFVYKKNLVRTTYTPVKTTSTHQVVQIGFTSDAGPGPKWVPFHADYYKLRKKGRHPVILLLPILKGKERIIKSFARFFAENGYATIIVQRQKSFKSMKTFDDVNILLHQAIINHKLVLDWLETRHEIDNDNIGVLGISMGGIKAALISAVDKRIKAGVFIIAAGDIPYILMNTQENGLVRKRKAHLEKYDISQAQLYEKLKSEITFDPLIYAPYINSEKTLMVLAIFDTITLISKGKELKKRIGNPETIFLPTGHFTAVFFKPYVMKKALIFFNTKLDLKTDFSNIR